MSGGCTGKILGVNLATKSTSTIDTVKYEEFGGGFGFGAAIFRDLAVALGEWDLKDAHDPRNVLALMGGPLAATGVPGALCGEESSTWTSPGHLPSLIGRCRMLPDWAGIKFLYDQRVLGPGEKSISVLCRWNSGANWNFMKPSAMRSPGEPGSGMRLPKGRSKHVP